MLRRLDGYSIARAPRPRKTVLLEETGVTRLETIALIQDARND
jgi:hypothetical protein